MDFHSPAKQLEFYEYRGAHVQELMDSNFKCISGGNTCKPNTNGGPHLGFLSGGIYLVR